MGDSTRIPGFRYVGTTSDPAFVTDDGRVRIRRVTRRAWAVQPGGVGGFEVVGRDAAVREAKRVSAEIAAEEARVLGRGRELLSQGRAPEKKSTAQIKRDIDEILDDKPVQPALNRLPRGWADWAKAEHRLQVNYGSPDFGRHGGFVKWAEPPPANPSEERYAVILDEDRFVRWVRVSPNPDVPHKVSGGAFYDDMPGGAVEAAVQSARQHKKKIHALVHE